MVFQSYALWPHMTVGANVAFGLEERRLPRAEIESASRRRWSWSASPISRTAGPRSSPAASSSASRSPAPSSIEPKVLLLDEPLSNLDAKMRVQVRRELRDLQQRLGLTTIFVTHDQEEANTICDRIAVMNDGVIQQVGTPMELYAKPANLFVANFLGTANILPGRVVRNGDSADLRDRGRAQHPGSGGCRGAGRCKARIPAAACEPRGGGARRAGAARHRHPHGIPWLDPALWRPDRCHRGSHRHAVSFGRCALRRGNTRQGRPVAALRHLACLLGDFRNGSMTQLKAIIFDLDGTLVDSAEDLRNAANALLGEEDPPPVSLEDIKAMIGDGVAKLVERAILRTGGEVAALPRLVARFMQIYEADASRHTLAYPGVRGTLEALSRMGLRLAVVTNKPHAATIAILEIARSFGVLRRRHRRRHARRAQAASGTDRGGSSAAGNWRRRGLHGRRQLP